MRSAHQRRFAGFKPKPTQTDAGNPFIQGLQIEPESRDQIGSPKLGHHIQSHKLASLGMAITVPCRVHYADLNYQEPWRDARDLRLFDRY